MLVQTWVQIIANSLLILWEGFVSFLPSLLGAIVVFVVGWLIAAGLGRIAEQIVQAIRIDQALEKLGLGRVLERARLKLDTGRFVGWLVQWFFVIVFLLAASDILGLTELTQFLKDVLLYIPNIIIAVLILLAAVVVGNILERIVVATVSAAGGPSARFLGATTRWAIFVFAVLAALVQLRIAASLVNTLVTGLVALLAIAGGLAFGLGGKDAAHDFIAKMRKDIGGA